MTLEELIIEIRERKTLAQEFLDESKSAGVNSPGFNQNLGYYDALGELLEWIEEKGT